MQMAIAMNKASNNLIAPVKILSINISLKEFVKRRPDIKIIVIPILICSLDSPSPMSTAIDDRRDITKPHTQITINLFIFIFLSRASASLIRQAIKPPMMASLKFDPKKIQKPKAMRK